MEMATIEKSHLLVRLRKKARPLASSLSNCSVVIKVSRKLLKIRIVVIIDSLIFSVHEIARIECETRTSFPIVFMLIVLEFMSP